MTTGDEAGQLADYLRRVRKAKGYTQDRLADEAGVHRTTVIRWERGETIPDPETLQKVTDILGVPFREALAFLHGADAELPPPLPRPLAELLDVYLAMDDRDRAALLDHVGMVVQWGRYRLQEAEAARTRHSRRAS